MCLKCWSINGQTTLRFDLQVQKVNVQMMEYQVAGNLKNCIPRARSLI